MSSLPCQTSAFMQISSVAKVCYPPRAPRSVFGGFLWNVPRVDALTASRQTAGGRGTMSAIAPSQRAVERIEDAGAVLAGQSQFLAATLSSIPDFVCAFDVQRRFAYANPAVLGLFGCSADEVLGKTFADLDYPVDLADRLTRHIDVILRDGVTVEDEVFYRSPTGHAAYFAFLWGPVRGED